MHLWVRRIAVLATALGFLAGSMMRPALAVALAQPCHEQQPALHSAHGHDGHAAHSASDMDQGEPSAPVEAACFKCCGICTVAPSLAETSLRIGARLVGYPVDYFIAARSYADRPLIIDPGIPKRIA